MFIKLRFRQFTLLLHLKMSQALIIFVLIVVAPDALGVFLETLSDRGPEPSSSLGCNTGSVLWCGEMQGRGNIPQLCGWFLNFQ